MGAGRFGMWGAVAMGAAAAAGAAAWGYHFATGRDALRDGRDKLRLQSRSLAQWDAFCAANPHRSDIVVCLTTTPSRSVRLAGVLKSLLAQSLRPQAIRLHLPHFSQREGCAYAVPAEVAALTCVEIVRCADEGPATKLLPALGALPAGQKILVVDDDRLYPSDLLEVFARWAAALPDAALGLSGWCAPDDLTDRDVTLLDTLRGRPPAPVKATRLHAPRRVDILMGYTGYLVRPAFFDIAEVTDYRTAPPAAFYVDDIWLSAHCRAPRYVIPARRHCSIPRKDWFFYDRNALYRINERGEPQARNTSVMLHYFGERWLNAT